MFPNEKVFINITHALLHTKNIYYVYYTTQTNLIIYNNTSHMTVTSPKPKWMRVGDTVRRFYHLLLWRGEFYFAGVGNFEKKITQNCNALGQSVISYIGVS